MQTPDSSEIAKHLRTIHLALVLACVLVLTVLFGGSPGSVETAHNQLQNVVAIKENWSSWTRRFGHEQLTWLKEKGITPLKILRSQLFITHEELARRNLSTQTNEWSVSPKYISYLYVYIRRPPANTDREAILAWAQNTEQGLEVNAGGSSGEPALLRTLQDFRRCGQH